MAILTVTILCTPRIPKYIFAYDLLGMSYEEDEESIDDEEIDDSSQDR